MPIYIGMRILWREGFPRICKFGIFHLNLIQFYKLGENYIYAESKKKYLRIWY